MGTVSRWPISGQGRILSSPAWVRWLYQVYISPNIDASPIQTLELAQGHDLWCAHRDAIVGVMC